jgi:hypothetical protein
VLFLTVQPLEGACREVPWLPGISIIACAKIRSKFSTKAYSSKHARAQVIREESYLAYLGHRRVDATTVRIPSLHRAVEVTLEAEDLHHQRVNEPCPTPTLCPLPNVFSMHCSRLIHESISARGNEKWVKWHRRITCATREFWLR